MPPKVYLTFGKHGSDLRAMPAYIERDDIAGVKVISCQPGNPSQGMPTVLGIIILNDPQTGAPVAILDGTYITSARTGAAGGVAAKYLARRDSRVIGLVGAGIQARTQLTAINHVLPKLEEVKVWGQTEAERKKFVEDMESHVNANFRQVSELKDVAVNSDIIVTTTPSRKPLVMRAWVKDGTHINAIGADAPGKQELDPALLKGFKIVVDDFTQAWHTGEINVSVSQGELKRGNIHAEMGEIITGKKDGRVSDTEVTIFDSTGLAIQDVATANYVYREALKKNLGQRIKLLE